MLIFADEDKQTIHIGELASLLDRTVLTIKRWEAESIIPKAKRDSRNWRYYTPDDVNEIRKIAEARVPKYA